MKRTIVPASSIGKTAYCPHAHSLSLKHKPDKITVNRMSIGNVKHNKITVEAKHIDKNQKPSRNLKWIFIIGIVAVIITIIF